MSLRIIERLQSATVATTYHLEAYLAHHPAPGLDAKALRLAIEERGGRVLESSLLPSADLDPRIAATLRHQFAHHLAGAVPVNGNGAAHALFAVLPDPTVAREPEPVA